MNRLIGALLVTAALGTPAAAQDYWGMDPLRTFCTSPAGDYCVSFFAMELIEYNRSVRDTPDGPVVSLAGSWGATVGVFGQSVKADEPIEVNGFLTVPTECGGSPRQNLYPGAPVPGAPLGMVTMFENNVLGGCLLADADPSLVRDPTPDDLSSRLMVINGNARERVGRCVIGDSCVEVPEPSPLLLVLGGVLAAAAVRRRRV